MKLVRSTYGKSNLNAAKIVDCVYNFFALFWHIHKELDPLECENPLSCLVAFCFARIGLIFDALTVKTCHLAGAEFKI